MALYVIILSKFLIQISLFLKLMILVISGASIYFLTLFILGVFNKNDIIDIIQS